MRGVFWEEFFGKYEMNFFGRISLREIFWEGCFERNSLFTLLKSAKLLGIDLFVKILVFVKILGVMQEGRPRNLDP